MPIRQDLVDSAVTFLQDPSVANSPLDKRIAFLQSKNLTQEEIDASLAQAGGNYGFQQQQMARQSMPQQPYGYGQNPGGYWPQPPPEVPRRDWRDYFIMATVMSGLSYGVYFLAKRYVVPLIAPPTPPQLEQDKATIDDSFSRAFALIDQLTTDTAAIKESEAARTERLDSALAEMEGIVADMKTSTRRRDDDSRRINDEVRSLQALIPRAMKAQEESTDARLKELNAELRSLKTLISNRMSGQGVAQSAVPRTPTTATAAASGANMFGAAGTASVAESSSGEGAPIAAAPVFEADRSNASGTSFNRFGRSGGIPEWQRSAAKKSEEKKEAEANETDATAAPASSNVS